MNTLLIVGVAYIAALVLIVYPLMRKAAPQNEAEQLENDNEQVDYLRNRRSSKYWDEL